MKRLLSLSIATVLWGCLVVTSVCAQSGSGGGLRAGARGSSQSLGEQMASQSKTPPLNAAQSNPNLMGWMEGFPPPADKILSPKDGSFFQFPALRYSVNHMQEFSTTRSVMASKE